jgi:hypothetical protein
VGIDGRFLESEVKIESPGGIVDGVNQHRSDADYAGSFLDARQRVKE